MQLIPVIDIKEGRAVQAKLGLRQYYQPLRTLLCPKNEVIDVVNCFLRLHNFKIIYLADLDSITKSGNNQALITNVLQRYPEIIFWVDSGYQPYPSRQFSVYNNYQPVLGSESYSKNSLNDLKSFGHKFILSLDFSAQGVALGAKTLFSEQSLWPQQVILMTLARVGSNLGIDKEKLLYYQCVSPKTDFIASGGVRSIDDVLLLKTIGVQKILCASALHNKAILSDDIKKL